MFWGGEYQEPLKFPQAVRATLHRSVEHVKQNTTSTSLPMTNGAKPSLLNLKRGGNGTRLAPSAATVKKVIPAVIEFRVRQDVRYDFIVGCCMVVSGL